MGRVMISMDDDLLKRVDEMAKALYTNRSAYISMTIAQVIKTQEDAMGMMKQVAERAIEKQKDEK